MTPPVAFPLKLAAAVSGSELIAQATRAVGLCPPRMVALPERMRTRS